MKYEVFGPFHANTPIYFNISQYSTANTLKNIEMSLNFLVWKFCGNVQFSHGNFALPQNFHSRKLDEIEVFYTVTVDRITNKRFSNCFYWKWFQKTTYSEKMSEIFLEVHGNTFLWKISRVQLVQKKIAQKDGKG